MLKSVFYLTTPNVSLVLILCLTSLPAHANWSCSKYFRTVYDRYLAWTVYRAVPEKQFNADKLSEVYAELVREGIHSEQRLLKGKPLDFETTGALIAARLPEAEAQKFLLGLKQIFDEDRIMIQQGEVLPDKFSRLQNRGPLVERRSVFLWHSPEYTNRQALEAALMRWVDLYSEYKLLPITRWNSIHQNKASLTTGNIEALNEHLLLQYFSMNGKRRGGIGTEQSVMSQRLAQFFTIFAATEKQMLKRVRLNAQLHELLKREGPAAVFAEIKSKYGLPLALNYWFTHLNNAQMFALLGIAVVVTPSVYESYQKMNAAAEIEFSSNKEYEEAKEIFDNMTKKPGDLISEIQKKSQLKGNPEMQKFLDELKKAVDQDELDRKKNTGAL